MLDSHTHTQNQYLSDENVHEDFSPKPLSKGLGFHQKKELRTKASNIAFRKENGELSKSIDELLYSDLDKFYGKDKKPVSNEPQVHGPDYLATPKGIATRKLMAFAVDLVIIVLMIALTVLLSWNLTNMGLVKFFGMMSSSSWALFSIITFSLFYVLYFGILDLQGSIGKKVLGLKISSIEKGRLTFKQTLTRSIVSLVSVVLIGFPAALDFHGKLSDSLVEEN